MRILDGGKKRRAFNIVTFDPSGRLLAAGGDYQPTVVWDVVAGAELARFDAYPVGRELHFQPRTGKLVLATPLGVRLCDLGTKQMGLPDDTVRAIAFDPGADRAVFCGQRADGPRWQLRSAAHFGEPDQAPLWAAPIGDASDESGYAYTLAFLSGDRFVSGERVDSPRVGEGRFRLAVRAADDARLLRASPNYAFNYNQALSASPVSELIVVQDAAQLRVYRSDDLTAPPRVLKNERRKHFTGVAFHPGGRYLAVTSTNTVRLFDPASLEVAKTFTWNAGKMRSVCFSPDGSLGAAGTDAGTVVVWDMDL